MGRLNLLKINNKVKSYYGFLERARQVVYGVDNFEKKKLYLIMYSSALSDSSKERCHRLGEKNNCKVYEIEKSDFFELTKNDKILAIASKSEELAKAIISQMEI